MQLEIIDIARISMWEKAKRKLLDDGSSSHSVGYKVKKYVKFMCVKGQN